MWEPDTATMNVAIVTDISQLKISNILLQQTLSSKQRK